MDTESEPDWTRKISRSPSLSKSRNAAPAPLTSGSRNFPSAPGSCTKSRPTSFVISVKPVKIASPPWGEAGVNPDETRKSPKKKALCIFECFRLPL